MAIPLRVLIVEDRSSDVELMLSELRNGGFEPSWEVVQTEADYLARLDPALDVILADYTLPGFDARRALGLLLERGLDVPLIIITGTVSEEVAVECMKQGAADYLLKDRLARLGQSVTRALGQRRAARERLRTLEALTDSEQRYRALFEESRDAIYAVTRAGDFIDANQAMIELLGYTREEMRRLNTAEIYAQPEDRLAFQEAIERAGSVRDYEVRFRKRDGTEIVCLLTSTVRWGRGGEILGYQGIARDITERRRLDEQLRQLQKMEAVGRLASGVAHDFNNLLTVITGRTELLLARLKGEDPLRRDVVLIQKTAERAAALTAQLLAFSRKQVLQLKVLDLNEVLAGLGPMLQRLLGEDIDLVVVPAAGGCRIRADRGQIEQVIVNLGANARDAMPGGGQLTIETASVEIDEDYARRHVAVVPGPYVMLAVSDTGIGMDAGIQARLFEPFFTTKEVGKGTGLGLATVYGIVKQLGGNIWVYSEPGHGATFKIYLPRVEADVEPAESAEPPESPRGTETVLLVEDEEAVRDLAREILEAQGYTVVAARHPGEALLIVERHSGPIHLLLTDVVMPQMSGPSLAERLSPTRPEMKVLYISGYTDNAVIRRGVLAPGTPLLQKPFTPDALVRRVREVLDTP